MGRLARMCLAVVAVGSLSLIARGDAPPGDASRPIKESRVMSRFKLESASFAHDASIPEKHTCEGADVSPALSWSAAPEGTKSFALIVDDPDAPDPRAPKRVWVHWVLYDVPATATGIAEGKKGHTALPEGTREGKNDWGKTGYGGPCPPIGRHRYFHKLYALDVVLGDRGALTKAELEKVMKGHVLDSAELVGTYQKHGS